MRWVHGTVVAALALAVIGAACDDPAIQLTYRPAVGSKTVYRLKVSTSTTTKLEGEATTHRNESFVLRSEQLVQSAAPGSETQVSVRLTGAGRDARDFQVRLDRGGQLASVETVGGVPASALGNLGISELLPSAAGALPSKPLRPGDRWRINQLLRIGGARAGRLVGFGRLASLGVSDGTKQAMVDTEVALPVDRTTAGEGGGTVHLIGAVRTTMHVTQRVIDGVVLAATAKSVGRYDVTLLPPTPEGGPPIVGTLVVTVRSTTNAR